MEQVLARNSAADRITQREQILNGAGPVLDELYATLDAVTAAVQTSERTAAHQREMRRQHEIQEQAAIAAYKSGLQDWQAEREALVAALRALTTASMADPAGMVAAYEAARVLLEKYPKA